MSTVNSNFDKDKAVIKMVILTKTGDNPVWYNFLKHNSWSHSNIINGMKRRFMNSRLSNSAQVIQFYNNQTDMLIEEHHQ